MILLLLTSLIADAAVQAQTPLPPLAVEISAEHPLFVFQDGNTTLLPPAGYAAAVVEHWAQIPEGVRPYSMMLVSPATSVRQIDRLVVASGDIVGRLVA